MTKKAVFFTLTLIASFIFSSKINAINYLSPSKINQPTNVGGGALPTSQQQGTFFSFGQNIVDKDTLQIYFQPSYLKAPNEHYLELLPALLYGITDNASLYLTLPVAANYRSGTHHSSGFADASAQLEYAFYNATHSTYFDQATFVTALSLPTGSAYKSPATGYGAPTFFAGTTYSHTSPDWLLFVSPGLLATTIHNNIRFGSTYYYECGIGKNILSIKDKYIFSGMVEFDGQYSDKDQISNRLDPNSGGNIIYITPSLWLSTKKLIIQLGLSLPISQHLNGNQDNTRYSVAANFGWTLNS